MRPLPFGPAFDCVFVDAPCSGLGTLRRDPDIRWRRQEGELRALADSQLEMLRHAAAARPICPEGDRYCGIPVWKLEIREYERVL